MKKIFLVLMSLMLCISLTACAPNEGTKNYSTHSGLNAIVGYDYLYYDKDTKVVYFIFNECLGHIGYGYMSPYYAPNGFPYLYDVKTQTLIEIDDTE